MTETAERRGGLAPYLPAAFVTVFSAFAAGAASLAAPATGKVAVVFPPGLSHQEAALRVVAAGGSPIDVGGLDNIVIAWSPSPAFGDRVGEGGAWLTFDPLGLGGCFRSVLR